MYRKALNIFSLAAGSFALGYGIKYQYFKETQCDSQSAEVVSTKDTEKSDVEEKEVLVNSVQETQSPSISQAICKARELAYRLKDEVGAPGLVIGVSIDGKTVWTEGLGLADVENRVPCHPDTVMRIASISKSITMAVVAKLWQQGKLDLDKPVQHYVPSFPKKTFDKQEVTITTRQLVSHISGIRHYKTHEENNHTNKTKKNDEKGIGKEMYIKERYQTVEDSLKLFQDDDLMFKPGSSFLYTTHGWTLVSAVVEGVSKQPFPKVMMEFFQVMGLKHTYFDVPERLIYNRARYYDRDTRGRLRNVPYVDNSYKWAGGGFLSTVGDLLHFGNAMLYSYQWQKGMDSPAGYLECDTVKTMWTAGPNKSSGRGVGYGMGWGVVPPRQEYGGGDIQSFAVTHSGGAIGASSVLLMVPSPHANIAVPSGVSVAIITNLQGVMLDHLAFNVAALFCKAQPATNPHTSQTYGG